MSSPAFIFIETLYLGIRKIIHNFHFQMFEFDCLNVGLLSFVFSAYKNIFLQKPFLYATITRHWVLQTKTSHRTGRRDMIRISIGWQRIVTKTVRQILLLYGCHQFIKVRYKQRSQQRIHCHTEYHSRT